MHSLCFHLSYRTGAGLCNWNNMRWQYFWRLHYNSLCVLRVGSLSSSLCVIAENKCLVIERDRVTLSCAPLTCLRNRWCLRTMLCCTVHCSHSDMAARLLCPFPIMWQGHLSDWSDPNTDLPLERTVFENRGWGERQGRVSHKCHIQQLLCFQWHLNWNRHAQQGTGFKTFFLDTSEKRCSWRAYWCVSINRAAMEFTGLEASVLFAVTLLLCCLWFGTVQFRFNTLLNSDC